MNFYSMGRGQSKEAVPDTPIPNPSNDLYLMDIPTAALRLSTTVFAVRRLCRTGKIKFVVIGHGWLISPEALQEFIRKTEAYIAVKTRRTE